jgi:hypothetical protein
MFKSMIAAMLIAVSATAAHAGEDIIPVEKFQPPITVDFAPERPHGWELERPMMAYSMTDVLPK